MKIEPAEFVRLLKRATIWSSEPGLERVELNFEEDRVTVSQKNEMQTMGVGLIAKSDIFADYDAIGKVQIPTERIVDAVGTGFRSSDEIEIEFDDGRVVIDGDRDHYEKELAEEDLSTKEFEADVEDYGIVPTDFELGKYYTLSSKELNNIVEIETEKEIYHLDFGDDLTIKSQLEDGEGNIVEGFSRDLEFDNDGKDGEGKTKVAAEYLQNAVNQMDEEFTIGFIGEMAPAILTCKDEETSWFYLIAPWGKE